MPPRFALYRHVVATISWGILATSGLPNQQQHRYRALTAEPHNIDYSRAVPRWHGKDTGGYLDADGPQRDALARAALLRGSPLLSVHRVNVAIWFVKQTFTRQRRP